MHFGLEEITSHGELSPEGALFGELDVFVVSDGSYLVVGCIGQPLTHLNIVLVPSVAGVWLQRELLIS